MSAVWGNNLKLTIFGESHGEGIGVVLDGIPAGLALDEELIKLDMKRRAPGRNSWSTPRKEEDVPEILSGLYKGRTTGAPLAMLIRNTNQRSEAYKELMGKARPGHADWSGHVKFGGWNDPRGGGHFSGRLTAGLVFAGAIAKQYLSLLNIECGAWITSIGKVKDVNIYPEGISKEWLSSLNLLDFPVKEQNLAELMQKEVEEAKIEDDSVGGSIAVCAINVPCGWGEPFFSSVESLLSSLLFSIPAIKGVEFGSGFEISKMRGSEANDEWFLEEGCMKTKTNHNGGINGGISNGMPILAHVAVKPTSSIAKTQKTVNYIENKEIELNVLGRHDPCIVPRAVPVVEAAMALTLLDLAIGVLGNQEVGKWMK